MTNRVLFVDDDERVNAFNARSLSRAGYLTEQASGGALGIKMLRKQSFDAVVCDLKMPEVDGLDVLRSSHELENAPPIIMLTAFGTVSVAVKAMKHGAADFLEKPVSPEDLRASIQMVIDRHKPKPKRTKSQINRPTTHGLVGSKRWLDPFLTYLQRIANARATVLIDGETGTGKSAVAREIWRRSSRKDAPFVELNCAAIPESLLESELFGHLRGAFTGALTNHIGKVEQAHGGTLFLDEIGELKPELQAKLLHLLQEKTFCPVGGSGQREADVRFIAATNRNLEEESRKGTFRQDLYFRLNVIGLNIPPLRDRPDDVPILIDHFRQIGEDHETAPTFSENALKLLTCYDWPGNIRELENLMARLAVIHPNAVIEPEQLTDRIRASNKAIPSVSAPPIITTIGSSDEQISGIPSLADLGENTSLAQAVKSYERSLIEDALQQTKHNRSQAAKLLKMKRTTLIEKLKKMEQECKPS